MGSSTDLERHAAAIERRLSALSPEQLLNVLEDLIHQATSPRRHAPERFAEKRDALWAVVHHFDECKPYVRRLRDQTRHWLWGDFGTAPKLGRNPDPAARKLGERAKRVIVRLEFSPFVGPGRSRWHAAAKGLDDGDDAVCRLRPVVLRAVQAAAHNHRSRDLADGTEQYREALATLWQTCLREPPTARRMNTLMRLRPAAIANAIVAERLHLSPSRVQRLAARRQR